MSIKATLAAIKAAGMHGRYREGEYRVTYLPGEMSDERREDCASYTNDPADAIDTAKVNRETFDGLTPDQRRAMVKGTSF